MHSGIVEMKIPVDLDFIICVWAHVRSSYCYACLNLLPTYCFDVNSIAIIVAWKSKTSGKMKNK